MFGIFHFPYGAVLPKTPNPIFKAVLEAQKLRMPGRNTIHSLTFCPAWQAPCKGNEGKMSLGLIYKSSGAITPNWHDSYLTCGDTGINCNLVLNVVFIISTMNII